MTSRLRKALSMGALAFLLVPFLTGFDDFAQTALDCQAAVSHLVSCCPNFDSARLDCHQADSGCMASVTHEPALNRDASACIRATSCGELIASGVCARAQDAKAFVDDRTEAGLGPPPTHAQVCP